MHYHSQTVAENRTTGPHFHNKTTCSLFFFKAVVRVKRDKKSAEGKAVLPGNIKES